MKPLPFLIIFFTLCFSSCSQNLNNILNTKYSLILDYNTPENFPIQRLSVFVQSDGDVLRYDKMKLFSAGNNYEWNVADLCFFESGTQKYAGYSNFIVPFGESIPQGNYQIAMINADSKENLSSFTFFYDELILQKDKNSINNYVYEKQFLNYISIYDSENKMIFFGEKTEEFQNEKDIWLKYNNSNYYYDVFISQDESILCILPKKLIKSGDINE